LSGGYTAPEATRFSPVHGRKLLQDWVLVLGPS
jgi:hypothetical protein